MLLASPLTGLQAEALLYTLPAASKSFLDRHSRICQVGKVVKPAQLLGEDLAKLDDKSHYGRCAPFDSDLHGGGEAFNICTT